ncbi:MAG: Protein MAK16 [Ramalina farinacea]|uniref:Protein MAK16 n=1 Tax=Ramalina farinacea TaxID=258253 RepID=A0AA43TUW5_9LECA|nr:Protein MAK16 [Ramalina farinacea]
MASDEIVWQIINQQFCSFKLKVAREKTFCRNEHNVTGLCNRQSCPLANSRYATVRSDPTTGRLYLCTKTIERAHQPSKLWERIRLSPRYETALSQIEEKLIYWPEHMKHRCKQRLTRLTMVAIRTQRLMKEEERLGEKVVPKLAPKVRRREQTRERKAEAAAKVERAIERELMERLRSGAYGDRPLNVEEGVWKRVLKGLERGKEGVRDEDLDEGVLEEEEEVEYEMEGEEGVGEVEYVSGDDEEEDEEQELGDLEEWLGGESPGEDEGSEMDSDEADEDDDEDSSGRGSEDEGGKKLKPVAGTKRKAPMAKPPPRRSKGPKLEIEYENEEVEPLREAVLAR